MSWLSAGNSVILHQRGIQVREHLTDLMAATGSPRTLSRRVFVEFRGVERSENSLQLFEHGVDLDRHTLTVENLIGAHGARRGLGRWRDVNELAPNAVVDAMSRARSTE